MLCGAAGARSAVWILQAEPQFLVSVWSLSCPCLCRAPCHEALSSIV